jgi:hypothetical protein
MENIHKQEVNFELGQPWRTNGQSKETSKERFGIQSGGGSLASHFVCVSYSTIIQQVKHSCAPSFFN